MTVLFTSDLHLGHAKVAGLRGFDSAAEHDEAVADRWRSAVRPDDLIYVLGDLAASSPAHALDVLFHLPGRKRLVLGNHDRAHPMHRDAWQWGQRYADIFEAVAASGRVRACGHDVVLSHFPYVRDRGPARHLQWRLPDLGAPLLHGHTHGTERLSHTALGTPEVHVGLDAWGLTPVRDDVVADLLEVAA